MRVKEVPMRPLVMAIILLASVPALAQGGAQHQPDARQGAGLARDWCANCHVVGQELGGRGTDAVPSFVSIARDPKKGPDYIRGVLSGPHPPMPPMPLSHAAVEDLVAYFKALQADQR
jgi:mono/diheme cytochrome c family protein